jgi:predicted phage-related endonuclease
MEKFQKTYPDLQYHATKANVNECELKLIKEIESVKLEIEEVKKETKEIESRLSKKIKKIQALIPSSCFLSI